VTNTTCGHNEPKPESSWQWEDYLKTKEASKKLYNNKKRIIEKKLPARRLIPRKVI
jgi:hypothetical protein